MIYKKRLNNNVVVAVDEKGNEKILTGKGLGFQMPAGEVVDETRVEKTFELVDSTANKRLQELFKTIPIEHVSLAEDIVSYAKKSIPGRINDNVIVSLCDHIYMAVERKKQDIEVKNVMLWDIQKFYRDEYNVGLYALEQIKKNFDVSLSEDEAGFIALHIVNAQLDTKTKTVKEITKVMQDIETIVRITFSIDLDTTSVYYYRFITHLKFFAERLFSNNTYKDQDVNNMFDLVKMKYKQEVACVNKIAAFLEKQYNYELSDEEMLYLSIHISRIVQVSKQNGNKDS